MSRYIRVPPLRPLVLRSAIGVGLLAPLVTLLFVIDPGGLTRLQPMMLFGLLLALAFAGMQAMARMRLHEQARPVPVRVRTGNRRLPR